MPILRFSSATCSSEIMNNGPDREAVIICTNLLACSLLQDH